MEGTDAKSEEEEKDQDKPEVVEALEGYLKERVSEVRASTRLVDSPACLVISDQDMGLQMRKIMEAAGQEVPSSKPILEVNLKHPILNRIQGLSGTEQFDDLAEILFDQASLSVGEQLDDPVAYVQRINRLLLEMAP